MSPWEIGRTGQQIVGSPLEGGCNSGTQLTHCIGYQILLTDHDATIITTAVGVWITLCWPFVLKICLVSLDWIITFGAQYLLPEIKKRFNNSESAPREEQESLLRPDGTASNDAQDATNSGHQSVEGIHEQRTGESSTEHTSLMSSYKKWRKAPGWIINSAKWFIGRQKNEDHVGVGLGLIVLFTLIFGGWITWQIAAVFSARVATDRAALWSSAHCGVWEFNSEKAGDDATTRAAVYNRGKEARAGEYARSCYETKNLLDTIDCHFFYRPNITYTTSYSWDCPFANSTICAKGQQIVTFNTSSVDASQIGVNSKEPYKFRRATTCAVLNDAFPYIRNSTRNGETAYEYYYGKLLDGGDPQEVEYEYSWRTVGNPFETRAPVYRMQ